MKLTKKSQEMMDILEEYFSEVTFSNPIATLSYGNRIVKISPEIFNYDYGGAGRKEKPRSLESAL